MKSTAQRMTVLIVAGVLVAVAVGAGKGNQIPPGQNPFAYILGLIDALQEQVDSLGEDPCADVADVIVGTWAVDNVGRGTVGQVTFAANGTYTIDSGTYNGGGSFFGATSGSYDTIEGRAIAFTYNNWVNPEPYSRIAVVECAQEDEIVHFLMGHTHDYEILTRLF